MNCWIFLTQISISNRRKYKNIIYLRGFLFDLFAMMKYEVEVKLEAKNDDRKRNLIGIVYV